MRAADWLKRSGEAALAGGRLQLKNRYVDSVLRDYLARALAGDVTKLPSAPLEIAVGQHERAFRLLVLPTTSTDASSASEPALLIVVLDSY